MKIKAIIVITLLVFVRLGFAQGFINLNFESTALTPNGSPGTVATIIGLPGWAASIGGTSQSTILYNETPLGNSAVGIYTGSYSPIDGNFSALLVGGASGNAIISQTGLVPANANSIFFDAIPDGFSTNNLEVSLNGQNIDTFLYSALSGYNVYAGDVSSFAGQTANLAFTVPASTPLVQIYVLDDISFSPTVVPEPGTLALVALGASLLGFRRWRNALR